MTPTTEILVSGTDIVSCFMGQNFTVPVYRGEIQARNLGMAVEAWSYEGKPVWGESGELVCLKPMPCQPTHFWNDENGSKYHKAYFSTFPGLRCVGSRRLLQDQPEDWRDRNAGEKVKLPRSAEQKHATAPTHAQRELGLNTDTYRARIRESSA
ncbi:hypothetical protein NFI96_025902 [Prochilodus magdalenae]|nr:hypothetical protein NFI96_025902 [Prochilodus magdalenae]